MSKRITVIKESGSGRNLEFRDNVKKLDMSRPTFVEKIKDGDYPKFHVRNVNGIDTPVSNPDTSRNNNLG